LPRKARFFFGWAEKKRAHTFTLPSPPFTLPPEIVLTSFPENADDIREIKTAEVSMFQYRVQSLAGLQTCMNVLSETDEAFYVHIVTLKDGYEVERKESMPRRLFETLLATGYITEVSAAREESA
jgi:hypothetical protein